MQLPPRYANPRHIGRGGMGEIFVAEDTSLGRTVAVKVLAERYAADESVRARFKHEALSAARLSAAPHTVTIFDVGEWQDRPYIVMEYLPGGTLADRLARDGAQPPGRAVDWLEDAAEALDAAHRHGVVHRDVKPGNLLIDAEGDVSVADFGIARATGLDSLTAAGTVLGTAGYLAPEQALGEPATPASDRYSLGVVAYELLTGRRPFESDSPTAEAAAHVNMPVPSVTAVAPSLPAGLDTVFERALAKEPDRRYESCGALVADLRNTLRRDATATRVIPPTAPTRRATPASSRRRRVPIWAVAAVVLLLLGAAGAALAAAVFSGSDPDARDVTVRETVTTHGATVVTTVTTEAPTTSATTETGDEDGDGQGQGGSPTALNDEGYRLMQAEDYAAALPLLEQAVAGAQGTGSLTEAYASYNLAYTRLALGSCEGVLDLLDRSQKLQGHRKEIDRLRKEAKKGCD